MNSLLEYIKTKIDQTTKSLIQKIKGPSLPTESAIKSSIQAFTNFFLPSPEDVKSSNNLIEKSKYGLDSWEELEMTLFDENYKEKVNKLNADIEKNKIKIAELEELKLSQGDSFDTKLQDELDLALNENAKLLNDQTNIKDEYKKLKIQKSENIQKAVNKIIDHIKSNPKPDILILCNLELFTIPQAICEMQDLKKILIFNNNISSIPSEIFNLKNLEELNISSNKIVSFPDEISDGCNLKKLNLGINQIEELPSNICKLNKLKELHLEFNKIQSIPSEIKHFTKLKKLNLSGNHITHTPPELQSLRELNKLLLNDNHLLEKPQLKSKEENITDSLIEDNKISDPDNKSDNEDENTDYDITDDSNLKKPHNSIKYGHDITDNPFLSNSFIIRLIDDAKFNEQEKNNNYKDLLSADDFKDNSLIISDSKKHESLYSRLYQIFDFFNINNQDHTSTSNGEYISNLINLFDSLLKEFSFYPLFEGSKMASCREGLKIISKIYNKKDDLEFTLKITNIISDISESNSIYKLVLTFKKIENLCYLDNPTNSSPDTKNNFLSNILVEMLANKIYQDRQNDISIIYDPKLINDLLEKIDEIYLQIFANLDQPKILHEKDQELNQLILDSKKIQFIKLLNMHLDRIDKSSEISSLIDKNTHLEISNELKKISADHKIKLKSTLICDQTIANPEQNKTKDLPIKPKSTFKSKLSRCFSSCLPSSKDL